MKNRIRMQSILFMLTLGLFMPGISTAEVAIIVHSSNEANISIQEIRRIFLGKQKHFANHKKATPFSRRSPAAEKTQFTSNILLKSDMQLKAYWAEILFTGKGVPPKELDSSDAVKLEVAKNPEAIGFIDASLVDESIRVIHRF